MSEEVNGLPSPQDAPEVPAEHLEPSASSEPVQDDVEAKKAEDKSKWAQRRINEITKKRYEAEGKLSAREQENEFLRRQLAELTGVATPAPAPKTESVEDVRTQARQEAALQVKAEQVFATGAKEIPDFQKKAELLGSTFEIGNTQIEVILDSDAPHKVLSYLADNLEEADEVLSLPPAKMARAIAKIEAKLESSKPKPSAAPKPIQPVKPAATPGEPDASDIARWIEARNKSAKRR